MFKSQVPKTHYDFEKYSHIGRWVSYYVQLKEALRLRPKSILEIGVGDKVFGNYIRENIDVVYTSVDVAEDLKPDVVGNVTKLSFSDASFDIVVAFEVLEHMPFEQFERAISEMARVARVGAVISLPHFGPPLKLSLKIPFLPEIKIAWKIPLPFKHIFNGEHYWEIGKEGYPTRHIQALLCKHFVLTKDFVPFESQYHHFFVLRKK